MFCVQCGKANVDEAKFCFSCGYDLKKSAPPASSPPDSRPSDPSGIGAGATGTPSDVSGIGAGATGTPSDASDSSADEQAQYERLRSEEVQARGAAEKAKSHLEEASRRLSELQPTENYSEDLGNGVRMDMIWIPGGTFQMGGDKGGYEKPIHTVELDGFWLGKYPVTQAQYQAITGQNPSNFKGANNPVEKVRWDDATEFCRRISQKAGKNYCQPTEAQWEYACRAGSNGRYCFGATESQLGEYAWFDGNSGSQTHPVGQKKPNQWGLFDMHGNVYEWCADWYGAYTAEKQRNPSGPSSGDFRVLRGGSWNRVPVRCRSAARGYSAPVSRNNYLGFRLARTEN
ncbi:MAG: SUMF1/EgtB/PvdO family nonheme iron enzyme [Candidatus Sumerlaeota bacterium]|nr:SUMF1/EgtB/PvdO family nonheme iron enzyme [Candidatus Sumerlaeota bacterium]